MASQLLIPALLHRQAGVVSRVQAMRAGLTPLQIDRLVARRRWRPVHPRVYRVGARELTDEARLRAAVLWAGDGAVPAGRAALWWYGLLPALPDSITLTVPGRCPDSRPGTDLRHRVLPDVDVVTVRGLMVPVRPLALLDAAVEVGPGGRALLRALRAHVGLAELEAVAEHAVGRTSARRLLAAEQRTRSAASTGDDVSCAPPAHRAEQRTSRNRYS